MDQDMDMRMTRRKKKLRRMSVSWFKCNKCHVFLRDQIKFLAHKAKHDTDEVGPSPLFETNFGNVTLDEVEEKAVGIFIPKIRLTPLEDMVNVCRIKFRSPVVLLKRLPQSIQLTNVGQGSQGKQCLLCHQSNCHTTHSMMEFKDGDSLVFKCFRSNSTFSKCKSLMDPMAECVQGEHAQVPPAQTEHAQEEITNIQPPSTRLLETESPLEFVPQRPLHPVNEQRLPLLPQDLTLTRLTLPAHNLPAQQPHFPAQNPLPRVENSVSIVSAPKVVSLPPPPPTARVQPLRLEPLPQIRQSQVVRSQWQGQGQAHIQQYSSTHFQGSLPAQFNPNPPPYHHTHHTSTSFAYSIMKDTPSQTVRFDYGRNAGNNFERVHIGFGNRNPKIIQNNIMVQLPESRNQPHHQPHPPIGQSNFKCYFCRISFPSAQILNDHLTYQCLPNAEMQRQVHPSAQTPFHPSAQTPFHRAAETPFHPTQTPFRSTVQTPFNPAQTPFHPSGQKPFYPAQTPFDPAQASFHLSAQTPVDSSAPFHSTTRTPFHATAQTPFHSTAQMPFHSSAQTPFHATAQTQFNNTDDDNDNDDDDPFPYGVSGIVDCILSSQLPLTALQGQGSTPTEQTPPPYGDKPSMDDPDDLSIVYEKPGFVSSPESQNLPPVPPLRSNYSNTGDLIEDMIRHHLRNSDITDTRRSPPPHPETSQNVRQLPQNCSQTNLRPTDPQAYAHQAYPYASQPKNPGQHHLTAEEQEQIQRFLGGGEQVQRFLSGGEQVQRFLGGGEQVHDTMFKNQVQHIPAPREQVQNFGGGKGQGKVTENFNRSTQYNCCFCPAIFKNVQIFRSHLREIHNATPPRERRPRPRHTLQFEKKNPTGETREGQGELETILSDFVCRKCGKPFGNESDRNEHVLKCLVGRVAPGGGIQQIPCSLCGKTFKTVRGLTAHIAVVHPRRIYGCFYCPENFWTANSLRNHQQDSYSCQGSTIRIRGDLGLPQFEN